MGNAIDIEIIHTEAGGVHPSGWLVRVGGEIAVVAPIEDAVRVALRVARNVARNTGSAVGITLVDEGGAVEIARFGAAPGRGENELLTAETA